MVTLRTRAKAAEFSYERTADDRIRIEYGNHREISISAKDYDRLVKAFSGQRVSLGASRTNPPKGSVGEWLQQSVTKTAIASYVGAILVHEERAVWIDDFTLQFLEQTAAGCTASFDYAARSLSGTQ